MADELPYPTLPSEYVAAARYNDSNHWVVGFVFSDREAGIAAMKAVAEMYNTLASRRAPT